MDIITLLIYSWLVFASFLTVYWGFIIIFTREWTKRIFTAKLLKRPLDFECMKGHSANVQVCKWKDGKLINEQGEPIQDFKDKGKGDIEQAYFYCNGVRFIVRPEGSLTALDNMFKPCLINQTWLDNYIQRRKIQIELGKKWFKSKAKVFPLLWIVLIILMFVIAYIMYIIFWA